MICDMCAFSGRCSASNPSKEYSCNDFVMACKFCRYNVVTTAGGFTKIGKAKIPTPPKHMCSKWNVELKPTDFCSWGSSR